MLLLGGEASGYKEIIFGKFLSQKGKKERFQSVHSRPKLFNWKKTFYFKKKDNGQEKNGNVMKRLELSDIVKT